jgi:anthranilate/para-aminobenzoate synthase component I
METLLIASEKEEEEEEEEKEVEQQTTMTWQRPLNIFFSLSYKHIFMSILLTFSNLPVVSGRFYSITIGTSFSTRNKNKVAIMPSCRNKNRSMYMFYILDLF